MKEITTTFIERQFLDGIKITLKGCFLSLQWRWGLNCNYCPRKRGFQFMYPWKHLRPYGARDRRHLNYMPVQWTEIGTEWGLVNDVQAPATAFHCPSYRVKAHTHVCTVEHNRRRKRSLASLVLGVMKWDLPLQLSGLKYRSDQHSFSACTVRS